MSLWILCLKIFFARILDVSFGTFRTMLMVKGKTFVATVIGFFEILIWFLVVREALNTNTDSIMIAISYALGFATGTYLGMYVSDKYIKEILSIKIITPNYIKLAKALDENGFAYTFLETKEKKGKAKNMMFFIELNSFSYQKLNKLIKEVDPKGFMVINECKYVRNGYFFDSIKK